MGEELLAEGTGWALADRTHRSPCLVEQLATQGGWLLARPLKPAHRGRYRSPCSLPA
jgi:hypothetical protein